MSVPSNIVEGSVRGSDTDFARFLHIASGSNAELEYQFFLASELGFMDSEIYQELATEINYIGGRLNNFIKRLKKK